MEISKLRKIVSKLPAKPGIYFFKDSDGKNIYIGKATSLKNRVLNYTKTDDVRIKKIVDMAKSLKHIVTDSDIEALILESQYIKKYYPMFNVAMRDDKQYFSVGFSKEKFSRIFLTHQPTQTRNSNIEISIGFSGFVSDFGFSASDFQYIGPFTDGNALKITLQLLRRIFPYCTCKQPHNNYCLNYHIGKCPGFCCLKDSPERTRRVIEDKNTYGKNIKAIRDILNGKKSSIIERLEKQMISRAENQNFQEAIELRDKLVRLKRVFKNAQIIKYGQINVLSHRYDNKTAELLQEKLGLKKLPRRIEAYDISNIQGQHATGSMVVFTLRQNLKQIKWKPDKNEYRRFKIHKVATSQDGTLINKNSGDTGMLREVLSRRFNHPEWPMPDLIIVDGGKQQLNTAIDAMRSWTSRKDPASISIIALTKNEKHFGIKITTEKYQIPLAALPADVKNLILYINSEAHRFAINYYRKLHRNLNHS